MFQILCVVQQWLTVGLQNVAEQSRGMATSAQQFHGEGMSNHVGEQT